MVEEQHPIKQGLKREADKHNENYQAVEEQHPLKQGLKPKTRLNMFDDMERRRATSTKTRIETHLYHQNPSSHQPSKSNIH